jgi:hypothetical protein
MSIPADDSVARFIPFIRPIAVSAWAAEDGKRNEHERKDGCVFCILLAIYVVAVHFLVYVDDGRQCARVTPYDKGKKVSSQHSQRASGC